MASMMFVEAVALSTCGEMMLTGAVASFSFVSPVTPVTVTSFKFKWRKNTSVESSA